MGGSCASFHGTSTASVPQFRKGIDAYFDAFDADVIMLQEVRALPEQLPKDWDWPEGYQTHLHCAEKKGYSGVATLSRSGFESIETGMAGSRR